jgi:hypothetical protein
MSGQREPHRKMAADGARAENAYPHGVSVLLGARRLNFPSFHKLAPRRNRSCGLRDTVRGVAAFKRLAQACARRVTSLRQASLTIYMVLGITGSPSACLVRPKKTPADSVMSPLSSRARVSGVGFVMGEPPGPPRPWRWGQYNSPRHRGRQITTSIEATRGFCRAGSGDTEGL